MILALLLAIQAAPPVKPVVLQTPEGAHEPQVAIGWTFPGRYPEEESAIDPAVSAKWRVHVVFGTSKAVYLSSSRDTGASFSEPVPIAEVGALALGMRRGPRIALSGRWVVVTAIAGEQGGGRDGDLLCWRSSDDGISWQRGSRINATDGSAREGLHAMASGPGAKVFCAWIDLAGDSPRICGALSEDAGGTWGDPVIVQGDSKAICPCCHPSVAIDGRGSVAVMWRGQAEGARDMFVARSKDGGRTFSGPARVGTGTWRLDACPMDGGALVSARGRTMAVWRRDTQVYRAELSGVEASMGEGEQPWITAGSAGFYVLWLRKRGGPLLSWSTGCQSPIEIDSAACDPVIASPDRHSGPVFAVWESGAGEHTKIVAAQISASK